MRSSSRHPARIERRAHRALLALAAVAISVGVVGVTPADAAEPGGIHGVLTDAAGAPAPGVAVYAQGTNPVVAGNFALTATDGSFSVPDLAPGTYRVYTQTPTPAGLVGAPVTVESVEVVEGQTTTLGAFPLLPPGQLTGRVTTEHGEAVPNASLTAYRPDGGNDNPSVNTGAIADANGYYTIPNLVPGVYTLNVQPAIPFGVPDPFTNLPRAVTLTGIVVAAGPPTTRDAVLPLPARINGTATRTDGGASPVSVVQACLSGNPTTGLCGTLAYLDVGGAYTLAGLEPGTYAVAAVYASAVGAIQAASPTTTVTLAPDGVATCTFVTGPGTSASCSVVAPDDGDGVAEAPGVDGNGDGTPDAEQPQVTTLSAAVGGGAITIAAPDTDYPLEAVSTAAVPTDPAPPATFPVGLVGFSVKLPTGVATADVDVRFPAGSNPETYWKLQHGAWVDFTSHVTIIGDLVTLHLVDGGVGDADGLVNGVIVDPGTFGLVNDAPRARLDVAHATEDAPLVIDVLANDDAGPGEGAQALTVTSVSNPPHASASVITTGPDAGKVRYVPDANHFGLDGFTYTVCDNGLPRLCATTFVVLLVKPVNDAPTISGASDTTTKKNKPVAFTVRVADVDNALAELSVHAGSSNPSLVPNGNVEVKGSGATRTVKVTPAHGRTGTTTVTLTVRDDWGATSATSFLLTVTN